MIVCAQPFHKYAPASTRWFGVTDVAVTVDSQGDVHGWPGAEGTGSDSPLSGTVGELRTRIGPADTDASGRMYYGAIFHLFDGAEIEMWRALALLSDVWRFPRVRVEAEFLHPLSFDDEVVVRASLASTRRRSFLVGHEVRHDGVVAARGASRLVCLGADGRPSELPPILRELARSAEHQSDRGAEPMADE